MVICHFPALNKRHDKTHTAFSFELMHIYSLTNLKKKKKKGRKRRVCPLVLFSKELAPVKEEQRPLLMKGENKKLTAPGIPRRSPIQVLTRPDPA